ncbi:MAG: phospho-N-acetylmuramoyl-pentapeptide-transferase [Peptoniphilaceae bacterium]|nr:phospho-N-acetylmuramoyl-pentapeptide-transferase [Peptoniphilaceae bacterium]MDY6018144.1 phospho-N-acetylmuramoyl-pentapeptide-transferase [Anaerococcus sp.]
MENIYIIILLSLILTLISGRIILPILKNKHIGQNIREEGPKAHYEKAGTPTMGGVIFLIPLIIMTLIFLPFSYQTLILLISTFGFGLIGFIDDYKKLVLKQNLGLTPRQKISLQFIVSLIISIISYLTNKEAITQLRIPFIDYKLYVGIIGIPIMMFILIGVSNAVNLTDGLDGLASSVSLPVFIAFAIIGVSVNSLVNRNFSLIMFATLSGFLVYNSNPASVFMGDTGSMAIGGAVGALALNLQIPIFLIFLGGVYMIETLSVIIQVLSYKFRNKKRVFLMSPIHHHYELKGYKEPKIVTSFTTVSVILSLITLIIVL